MTGPGYEFPSGAKAIAGESTQDWALIRTSDGKLIAKAEGEYTWRDEDEGVQLYVLISPTGRGAKLDTLNRNGLVLVDIKERLLRITVTDVVHKVTYRYQWLNLWGSVVPEKSKFHLSQDNKRIVVWLHKKYTTHEAGSWGDILDVRRGKYNRGVVGWPGVLLEVQGAWRSEDEEPIEIIGDQVVWPEGSRDLLVVDEESEVFRLIQAGDADKVAREEFEGIYERHAHRLKWEDGDYWTRIPGMAIKRQDAGKEALPLEYDKVLARWVPWLPPDELRRQITHWLPPTDAEITVNVALAECAGMKQQLLDSVDEGGDVVIADFDYLPVQLILKCRVCALASPELEGAGLVETMLALRDHRRVNLANEAAALGALERWLQWLRPWLAPGARCNVNGALEALRERLFEVVKDERKEACKEQPGRAEERWPPLWSCLPAQANELLKAASEELQSQLRSGGAGEPRLAFGEARRRIGERLFDNHRVEASARRCDPLERRWAKRYGQEASKSLLEAKHSRHLRRELSELGLAIVEDALDWGTLVKIHGEVRRLFSPELREELQLRVRAARGGHAQWARVWAAKLEELGMVGLAAAAAFMQQLAFWLSEWEFGKCRWAAEDPVLWTDDGQPLELGQQRALEWAAPDEGAGQPLGEDVEDRAGMPVPPERRVLAFLFLNTPAWVPEWGGALRCHLPEVHRDIWGDGGRLVLLREVRRYELLPAEHAHAVFIMRLRGAALASVPPPVQEEGPEEWGAQHEKLQEDICPDDDHQYILKKKAEIPESYHRSLSNEEVRTLGETLGAQDDENATATEDEDVVDDKDAARNEPEDVAGGELNLDTSAVVPEKPARLELDSHQAIKLFQNSFPAAFKLD